VVDGLSDLRVAGGAQRDRTTVSGSRYATETLAEIDTEEFPPAPQRE
jgi:hypothetical protein